MTDRAPMVAEFLVEFDAFRNAELARRFPGLTYDELKRGTEISLELLRVEAAELIAERGGAS